MKGPEVLAEILLEIVSSKSPRLRYLIDGEEDGGATASIPPRRNVSLTGGAPFRFEAVRGSYESGQTIRRCATT
jgi:hypothetical protein